MAAPDDWGAGFVDDPARQCGKRTYSTRAEAKSQVRRQIARGGPKLMVYRCPHCDMLHLGHAPTGHRSKQAS